MPAPIKYEENGSDTRGLIKPSPLLHLLAIRETDILLIRTAAPTGVMRILEADLCVSFVPGGAAILRPGWTSAVSCRKGKRDNSPRGGGEPFQDPFIEGVTVAWRLPDACGYIRLVNRGQGKTIHLGTITYTISPLWCSNNLLQFTRQEIYSGGRVEGKGWPMPEFRRGWEAIRSRVCHTAIDPG